MKKIELQKVLENDKVKIIGGTLKGQTGVLKELTLYEAIVVMDEIGFGVKTVDLEFIGKFNNHICNK